MKTIHDLPSELLAEIAVRTDALTVVSLCAVTRQLRAAVRVKAVFRGLIDRSPVVKELRARWTDALDPMQLDIDMWQRCAMADHQSSLVALPYHSNIFWYVPQDVIVPHLAQLAILKHPYVTSDAWRQLLGGPSMAEFAMIISSLTVRTFRQWRLAIDTNPEALGDAFNMLKNQILTLGHAFWIVHDLLMLNLDNYGNSGHRPMIEPPTIEELHIPTSRFEGFEQWHTEAVQQVVFAGKWEGCIWEMSGHDTQAFAVSICQPEDGIIRVSVEHGGVQYELHGVPTRDNSAFELTAHESSEAYGIIWKCMLTVFGLTGIVWHSTTEGYDIFGAFWVWRRGTLSVDDIPS